MSTELKYSVSCPGKVLICGGYLVLDPIYNGLVISTEARFYSRINEKIGDRKGILEVISKQFDNESWLFHKQVEEGLIEKFDDLHDKGNKFVYYACQAVYIYLINEYKKDQLILAKLNDNILIELVADNDFYSQRSKLQELNLPQNLESLFLLPKQNFLGGKISEAHKTGLGSSACLVTSLVGSLLVYFLGSKVDGLKDLIHNLAQFAHCKAQGKVGSGFDVAAAVYGSHIYRRFDPKILTNLLSKDKLDINEFTKTINMKWDQSIVSITLPPRFQLNLAEVDVGSNTPSMVSKVQKWKIDNPQLAEKIWSDLNLLNSKIILNFQLLFQQFKNDSNIYNQALDLCIKTINYQDLDVGTFDSKVRDVLELIKRLATTFSEIRQNLRSLTNLAGVPIEPSTQTFLLNKLESIPGSIMAGVPGAGGYDAVFTIFIQNTATLKLIQNEFDELKEMKVAPLVSEEDKHNGIIIEDSF